MRVIDFKESVELTRKILNMPPGEWTHVLNGNPVRLIERVVVVDKVIVFFRAEDYCGRWMGDQFDRYAKQYVEEVEQLTLF